MELALNKIGSNYSELRQEFRQKQVIDAKKNKKNP